MSALEIQAAEPSTVVIADLKRDVELSCRAKGVAKAVVADYATHMKAGVVFPPVVVFVDSKGVRWLADGFHRCAAAESAGWTEIAADIRQGARRDALLFAAGANSSHGLRRSNADKRRAVLLVLAAFPKLSDRKIGETCGVDNKTVAAARRSLEPGEEIPQGTVDVSKLELQLERVIARWPDERHDALRAWLTRMLAAFAAG